MADTLPSVVDHIDVLIRRQFLDASDPPSTPYSNTLVKYLTGTGGRELTESILSRPRPTTPRHETRLPNFPGITYNNKCRAVSSGAYDGGFEGLRMQWVTEWRDGVASFYKSYTNALSSGHQLSQVLCVVRAHNSNTLLWKELVTPLSDKVATPLSDKVATSACPQVTITPSKWDSETSFMSIRLISTEGKCATLDLFVRGELSLPKEEGPEEEGPWYGPYTNPCQHLTFDTSGCTNDNVNVIAHISKSDNVQFLRDIYQTHAVEQPVFGPLPEEDVPLEGESVAPIRSVGGRLGLVRAPLPFDNNGVTTALFEQLQKMWEHVRDQGECTEHFQYSTCCYQRPAMGCADARASLFCFRQPYKHFKWEDIYAMHNDQGNLDNVETLERQYVTPMLRDAFHAVLHKVCKGAILYERVRIHDDLHDSLDSWAWVVRSIARHKNSPLDLGKLWDNTNSKKDPINLSKAGNEYDIRTIDTNKVVLPWYSDIPIYKSKILFVAKT